MNDEELEIDCMFLAQSDKLGWQQEIALNLLKENVPLEIVSRTTGITIEQLQILRSQPENN